MRATIGLMIGAAMLCAWPIQAAAPTQAVVEDDVARQGRLLADGIDLIQAGKAAEAIDRFDRIIASFEQTHVGDKRRIYCAGTATETILYMGMAAEQHQDAVALEPTWCEAIFLKGFALIDLGRREEARSLLERAIEMSPYNSQYLAEFGEFKKSARDWQGALELFERAFDAAQFAIDSRRPMLQGRALRGQGFVLIELGELDKAEAMFRRSLKIDPDNAKARSELQFIKDQRKRMKAGT